MSGYGFGTDYAGNDRCISLDTVCSDKYGYGSKADGDGCVCKDGYAFETSYSGKKCVLQSCGLFSKFDDSIKQCICDDGYVMKDTGFGTKTCEKKEYSAYAVLSEYKNSEAIVAYRKATGGMTRSKITVYSCSKAKDYGGKVVVLNLMQDEILNSGDYLVLSNDQTCRISYANNNISDDETLLTCEDVFGVNSMDTVNGMCICKAGYEWSADRKSCVLRVTTGNSSCVRKYGGNATNMANGTCGCKVGYVLNFKKTACVSKKKSQIMEIR